MVSRSRYHPRWLINYFFEKGQGKCIIDGNEYLVSDGFAVIVPAGAQHNVINISTTEPLKLYTVYSPANHEELLLEY